MKIKIIYNKLKSILGLSFQLARAGFKLRNEGSYLGLLWYLLEPLLMFLILLTLRHVVGVGVESYPIYLFIGLIMFDFFRKTTIEATGVIFINGGLIKSTNVNREVFIVSTVLKNVFSHLIELIILIGLLVFYGISTVYIVFYLPILAVFALFVLGISFTVSIVGTYLIDFGKIWNVLTRILWFATPIFYSTRLELPININYVNPLYYFISITRDIIAYNRIPEVWMMVGAVVFSSVSFFCGLFIFKKFKHKLGEFV